MEVRVESAAGFELPTGCYVGVRVGDVLKQGRYEPQRSYHFPAVDRRRNAKIDIYRHVGSCIVGVDPDAKSMQEVNVASNDPTIPGMKLKVNVQSSVVDVAKQRANRTQAVKSQAKEYLSKFSIEEKLSEAVKALLKAQPADPTAFLCSHLSNNSAGFSAPTSPTGAFAPQARPNVGQSLGKAFVQQSKPKIGAPLGKPSGQAISVKPFSGYYSANCLPNVAASCMNNIYNKFPSAAKRLKPMVAEKAKKMAVGTARYYSAAILPNIPPAAWNSVWMKFPAAAKRLQPAGEGNEALDGLRTQARDLLVKASGDGGLAAALNDVRAESDKNAWASKPSIGTWLAKPQQLKKVQPFCKKPSVGSWLMYPPARDPEPAR